MKIEHSSKSDPKLDVIPKCVGSLLFTFQMGFQSTRALLLDSRPMVEMFTICLCSEFS